MKVTYIEHLGATHVVDAEASKSLMQLAVDHAVPGIYGDCGGCCSCATCHVYVDGAWKDRLPPVSEEEEALLDGALHREENSRLCCQITMTPALDGIVLRLPKSQF